MTFSQSWSYHPNQWVRVIRSCSHQQQGDQAGRAVYVQPQHLERVVGQLDVDAATVGAAHLQFGHARVEQRRLDGARHRVVQIAAALQNLPVSQAGRSVTRRRRTTAAHNQTHPHTYTHRWASLIGTAQIVIN